MSGTPVTRWQGVLFGLAIGWLAAYCHFKLPRALAPALALGGGWTVVGPLFGAVTAAALVLALWLVAACARLSAPSDSRRSR